MKTDDTIRARVHGLSPRPSLLSTCSTAAIFSTIAPPAALARSKAGFEADPFRAAPS